MLSTIAGFAPNDVEAGVGLALQEANGSYLFFLAGTRHHCPPGELFYAGIGGHREAGEDWLACAHREAREEVGTEIEILPASATWHVPHAGAVQRLDVADRPRPLAFYEMIHPADTPRAGQLYRIVIYRAGLCGPPQDLPPDEVLGVVALTAEQVIRGLERKPTLEDLISEGASIVAGCDDVNRLTRLYPLGTARALARVLAFSQDSPLSRLHRKGSK